MELFEQYWPVATGAIIVPAMRYLKAWVNHDWPVLWAGVMLVMNALMAYGINIWFGLGLALPDLWPFITGGIVTSVVVHSSLKTRDKHSQ